MSVRAFFGLSTLFLSLLTAGIPAVAQESGRQIEITQDGDYFGFGGSPPGPR